jgi:hypothetical protein
MEKIRTQLKIDGKLQDVEIENGEIKIIEQNPKQTGWERGKFRESYYAQDSRTTQHDIEVGNQYDYKRYSIANYFSNKELAENIFRMQKLQRQMFRWQAENDLVTDKCNANTKKYYIYYDFDIKELIVDYYCHITECAFSPNFSSCEKARECIEVFKDELIWLFTEFKWRMDSN